MNSQLLEELLNEDESTSLDFKRDQYPFEGATDDQKAELLKDILAFANSWRRTDAYILIGVEDIKGARKNVVGVTEHFDDAKLQQFINSKTQRPLTFSYEAVSFEGKQIGVIKIPLQDRPLYIMKDYGKLKKHEVFIRRGSSTDTATPDETAKMGRATVAAVESPDLSVEFINKRTDQNLGPNLDITSEIVTYDETKIPFVGDAVSAALGRNRNYKRELAQWIADTSLLKPINLMVNNNSPILAQNIHLSMSIKKEPHLILKTDSAYPSRPRKESFYPHIPLASIGGGYYVDAKEKHWTINVNFGSIQPRMSYVAGGRIYMGSTKPDQLKITATIYGDNIPNPIKTSLTINLTVKERKLDLKELDEK